MVILSVFLVLTDYLVIYQQRGQLFEQANGHVKHEAELFSRLITEALLKGDYATIEQFLGEWGRDSEDLVEARVTLANDFLLAEYLRDNPTQYPIEFSSEFKYGELGQARLSLVHDFSAVYKRAQLLSVQLVAGSILLVALLGFLLWRTLRRTAILPLQREIDERLRIEGELFRSARELEQARDEALAATRTKSEFLASMSHELRTPLNSIIGFTGIVKDGVAGPVTDEQNKQLTMVFNSAKHLLSLINGILDLSKVEAGKLEVNNEYFELVPLLNELKAVMQPQVDAKGLEMLLDVQNAPKMVYADRGKLRQSLLNLLGNAVKFTAQGSVTLRCRTQNPGNLSLEVIDTGQGIKEENQQQVFDSFRQLDQSDTRLQEGTGLGLTITKRFVELMGGSITLKSQLGIGSTFTIDLPIRDVISQSVADTHGNDARTSNKSGQTVLVVDDQPEALELFRNYLEREGYSVILCDNGTDAVSLAHEHQPFAITLDILMPKPDGWVTLAMLKNDPHTAYIPVVIVSILDEQNLGLSLGAVDYLQKPVEPMQLLDALETLRVSSSNIMVVEDHQQDAELIRAILEPEGYRVSHASSGADALARVDHRLPDLILLDLMMPGMSGFEFIRHLRARSLTQEIPVIVVSAKTLTDAERQYLHDNVEQVLVKGRFEREEMLQEVGEALAKIAAQNTPIQPTEK
jgi:signal transduction histidine kinase/DNA-binding response OmpR family regulator